MENTEIIVSLDSKRFDTRKVNNRAGHVQVPETFLDQLENDGLTSESLDSFKLPIFKYGTQITLHGQFPERDVKRIGGYKSAFLNQNGTLGVRYNAIDYRKKKELGDQLNIHHWSYSRNSKGDAYWLNAKDEAKARAIYNRIDVSPFYATKQLAVARLLGIYYVVVYVRAVYEKEVWPLFTAITGLSQAEQKPLMEAYQAEMAVKRAGEEERRAQRDQEWEEKVEEAKAALERDYLPQVADLPIWNGQFVPEMVVVSPYVEMTRPTFKIFQLMKRGGWYQYAGDHTSRLTDKPYENAMSYKRHSYKTVDELVKMLKRQSTRPFYVLSSPDVLPAPASGPAPSWKKPGSGESVTFSSAVVRQNPKKNGIEVEFRSQVPPALLDKLKSQLGYNWTSKGWWYVRNTPNTWQRTLDLFRSFLETPVNSAPSAAPSSVATGPSLRTQALAKAAAEQKILAYQLKFL